MPRTIPVRTQEISINQVSSSWGSILGEKEGLAVGN